MKSFPNFSLISSMTMKHETFFRNNSLFSVRYKCRNSGDTVFYSPFPPRFLQSELSLWEKVLLMVIYVAMVQEFTPDTSIESTEEFAARQHMVKEPYDLKTLDLHLSNSVKEY